MTFQSTRLVTVTVRVNSRLSVIEHNIVESGYPVKFIAHLEHKFYHPGGCCLYIRKFYIKMEIAFKGKRILVTGAGQG